MDRNILIIQSRCMPHTILSEQEGYRRVIGDQYRLSFLSSLDDTHAWHSPEEILNEYDAVILGGSGDFDFDGGRDHEDEARSTSRVITERVRNVVLHALERDFPLLGICYGHQIVSEVLGVRVVHDHAQKKVGTHPVILTDAGKSDVLFKDLPDVFGAQYMHKDSLSDIPEGAVLLAKSDCCKASVLRFGSRVYTMQFHPELRAEDLLWKIEAIPGYLPSGVDPRSITQPSPDASRIIPRFLEYVLE